MSKDTDILDSLALDSLVAYLKERRIVGPTAKFRRGLKFRMERIGCESTDGKVTQELVLRGSFQRHRKDPSRTAPRRHCITAAILQEGTLQFTELVGDIRAYHYLDLQDERLYERVAELTTRLIGSYSGFVTGEKEKPEKLADYIRLNPRPEDMVPYPETAPIDLPDPIGPDGGTWKMASSMVSNQYLRKYLYRHRKGKADQKDSTDEVWDWKNSTDEVWGWIHWVYLQYPGVLEKLRLRLHPATTNLEDWLLEQYSSDLDYVKGI